MSNKRKRSLGRSLIDVLILFAIFFILAEIILNVVYYHIYSSEKLASIQLVKNIDRSLSMNSNLNAAASQQKLIRENCPPEVTIAIGKETAKANRMVFEPWVDFKIEDFKGKYVNVEGLNRKTIPSAYTSSASSDTLLVYFFGGSTTFGYNVADDETIPSQFVKNYAEKFPKGKNIKVVNFSMLGYYSYQELLLFSQLLFTGRKPDIAIFIDGVNDFFFVRPAYERKPYFSHVLDRGFESRIFGINDLLRKELEADLPGIEPKQFYTVLINNYIENMRNIKIVGDSYNVKTYFFCQPVPFYKYPRQQSDPICYKERNTRYDLIYPQMEAKANSLPNFTFLGDMLEHYNGGYPFVDGLHYSPAFTSTIVNRILEKLSSEFVIPASVAVSN